MKLITTFLILFITNITKSAIAQSKFINSESETDQDLGLSKLSLDSNRCFFQGCDCSSKSKQASSITCDGEIYQQLKVMFPLRKEQANTEISDFLLMNHNIYSIPPKIFHQLNIKNLIFIDNSFDSIFFDSFADISSLSSLEFYDNDFSEIDKDSFAPLFDKLNRLVFYGNGFTEDAARKVQNSIQHFKNLTFLAIENFNLNDLSGWLKIGSKQLRVLDLSKNKFKSFSLFANSEKNSLNNLAELYLSSNLLGPLFYLSELEKCTNLLEILDLSKNNIQDLITGSNVFKKLRKLDLSNNMLKFVYRDYFKKMPSLTELNLENNLIYQIDIDSFHHNPSLTSLILSNNQINYLDPMLTDSLKTLKKLYLHTNYLDSMPSISNMSNLEILDISGQQVSIFNVPDYSFERKKPLTKMSLSMIFSPELVLNFGTKAFCSKNREKIVDYLQITHFNMPKSSVCLLSQLKNATIDLFRDVNSKFLYDFTRNKICNCYSLDYFSKEGINFGKSCKIDLTKCEQAIFNQQDRLAFDLDCNLSEQFEC